MGWIFMQRRITLSVAAAAVFLFGSDAMAHWQFTTWNMTADEVIGASKGTAWRGDGQSNMRGSTRDVSGVYMIGSNKIDVDYYFTSGRLSLVDLHSKDQNLCRNIQSDLEGIYGAPFERFPSANFPATEWLDRNKGNRVRMIMVFGTECELHYSPLISNSSQGL
ncbi:hypothetical protein H5V43_02230 [Sphingobium fuliginis]|uniref:Uncharacterized protein n=1 Tax=Sphingobium fuliginis (strain ATCC 27551) TaxID=336203 RepID=A0A7M2GHE6_SPHSA|nr:hypothetical protein [Sphingobium fuliginis]QOT72013.1 hypothetical protein H5V43_02230 [Sphingobium fuliginis]